MRLGVIYKMIVGDNFIIGSSLTPKKRENEYRRDLELGKWNNDYVQNSYNKYKKELTWEILQENIPENILEHVEDIWIGALCAKAQDNRKGMNMRDAYRSKLTEEAKNKVSKANSKIIYEYDLDGHFIREWGSIVSAARNKNISDYTIILNAKGKNKRGGNSMWSYVKFEKLTPYINNWGKGNMKAILQKDLNGDIIRTWESAEEAARNGFVNRYISEVCKGVRDFYRGFKWQYI